MRITAILQARVTSTRLPGKVLMPLLGEPMLARQIERVRRSLRIGTLLVATSTEPSDDGVAALCAKLGVVCYRGSLNDVLDRFYQAAKAWPAEAIVRLTGDCPLGDPALIDQVIAFFETSGVDYVSNVLEPTFPDGLDIEVFRFSALEAAWREARLPSEREHVTTYIYKKGSRFKTANFRHTEDLSRLRWTVDVADDFVLVEQIYAGLYPHNPSFSWLDVLAWARAHPELSSRNEGYLRNAGYTQTLKNDQFKGAH